jgi:hypothetical protein
VTKSFSDHVVTENREWKMFGQPLALKRAMNYISAQPLLRTISNGRVFLAILWQQKGFSDSIPKTLSHTLNSGLKT